MITLALFKYASTLMGIVLMVGAALNYTETRSFLMEASKTEGTVVELLKSQSSESTTYQPVVRFTSQSGEVVNFMSDMASHPPSYSEGQKVEVFYQPTDPHNARTGDFFSLWGMSAILAALGGVCVLTGVSMILAKTLKDRQDEDLKMKGTPIQADYQGVVLNPSLCVEGRHPFRIVTQWRNPSTSELHVFTSNNIWFNPKSYIKTKKIVVFIEPGNPKKYYVDISFLPRLAR